MLMFSDRYCNSDTTAVSEEYASHSSRIFCVRWAVPSREVVFREVVFREVVLKTCNLFLELSILDW